MGMCDWKSGTVVTRRLAVMIFLATVLRGAPSASVLGLEPGNLRLSNDDVGVILWGPDTAPTLSVGKSDVWDRRNPKPPQPILTLARMMEMARADGFRGLGSYYTVYGSYDFPCPKPVGQLILKLPFMESGGKLTVDRNRHDELALKASNGPKTLELRIFVSALRNLIVIEARSQGLAASDVAVRLYRHRDTIEPGGELNPTIGGKVSPKDFEPLGMPRAGGAAESFWIAQDFPPDPTFPHGFTSALAARVIGAPAKLTVDTGTPGLGTPMVAEREGRIDHGTYKRYTPINRAAGSATTATLSPHDGAFQIVAAAVTTQDDADPLGRAARDLAEAARLGTAALRKEHEAQLDAYERRPRARAWSADGKVNISETWGGTLYRVRPNGYYGDVALCSVVSTKFCFQDSSIWHGDFHFNEIHPNRAMILRQFDALDSYFRMIRTMLPMAQANAQEVYGCRGAMYPLVHYPLKSDTVVHTHVTWEQSMEITALLARPFWLRYLYTADARFLRELAWPVLREGARFYADFLKPASDGLYHVFPTVSPEHRGMTKDLRFNRDSQSGITLIRYHLRASARASALLGLEKREAARWREIADRMPDYPTIETPAGRIFTDVEGGNPIEYNIPVPLSAVFWGDDIGLDSPPAQLELARRTLREINVWLPHRFYLNGVRARLGVPASGDTLDVEHFLQSHTGVLRVFPAVPAGFEGGFENFGAQGAFVVSAKHTAGGVEFVKITSLAGNPCAVANPWPGREVLVEDAATGKRVAAQETDGRICFKTKPGNTYRLLLPALPHARNTMTNSAPPAAPRPAVTSPPLLSTIMRTMCRPSPRRWLFELTSRSKTCDSRSGAMPGPSSQTRIEM
jgi:hypothetical protein